MKRLVVFAVVAALAFAVTNAWALTLDPAISAIWRSDWTPTGNGDPYWDNSGDAPLLGDYVLNNWGQLPTLVASDNSSWVTDVTFQSPGSDWATILIEVAGLRNNNYFGIYQKGNPSNRYELFAGTQGPTASATFSPKTLLGTTDFGFYLETKVGQTVYWTWYSEAEFNQISGQGTPDPDKDLQHFAFFDAKTVAKYPSFVKGYTSQPPGFVWPWGNAYLVAVEDLPISGRYGGWDSADKDYNDFVVFVANIPDASTWMLFLSGVPAVLMLRRKRA